MSSLFLDIGNSSVKLIVKQPDGWGAVEKIPHSDMELLSQRINSDYLGYKIVCCSVRKDLAMILESRVDASSFTLLNVPMIPGRYLSYNSLDTLGMDRFLVCYAATAIAGKGVIVIDGGSACTVDFMTADGVYQGGAILPGLSLTERHFKHSLPELPLPEPVLPHQWPGKSTKECIQWGLYGGFTASIQHFIDLTLKQSGVDLQLFICGGDAERIADLLSDEHSVTAEPALLFKGMDFFHKKFS